MLTKASTDEEKYLDFHREAKKGCVNWVLAENLWETSQCDFGTVLHTSAYDATDVLGLATRERWHWQIDIPCMAAVYTSCDQHGVLQRDILEKLQNIPRAPSWAGIWVLDAEVRPSAMLKIIVKLSSILYFFIMPAWPQPSAERLPQGPKHGSVCLSGSLVQYQWHQCHP